MSLSDIKASLKASVDVEMEILKNQELLEKIARLAQRCTTALQQGGKIIFCGNGGSFADAQHLSAEFTSRFLFDRPGLASIALGTNSSAMTAIGNDYGYNNVFSRELEAIGNSDDLLIAITTSGNSINILKVLESADKAGISSVVLTGSGQGKLPTAAETINVPSAETARIQECHILIGHIVCGLAESEIFKTLRPRELA